ncbi:MAG: DNA/RNA non-specific endonuclease [Alistipes sp.]|nr:DNA/RNA non-specific endonuclease [Alistipes sp.]
MRKFFYFCAVLLPLLYVACGPLPEGEEEAATYLKVTPSELTFDATVKKAIKIETDGKWAITTSGSVTLSQLNGEKGISTVYVLSMTATTPQTLLVRTPGNTALSAIVKVLPPQSGDNPTPTPAVTLYYDNLDGNTSYTGWADSNTSWQNFTGEGAGNISYNTKSAYVRNDNYGSASKYTGASGKGYIRVSAPSGETRYLEVCNIATNGKKDFTFSFGAAFKSSQCNLYVKGDDSSWIELDYTSSSAYNSWTLAKASFSLVGNVTKLSFRIEPTDANVSFGYNIDDLRLETSAGGQSIEIGTKANYKWAELPDAKTTKTEYRYHTHWSNTVRSNQRVRNYSYCYDVRRHSPMWIAHPHHAIYEEGGKTRPSSDPWACDPYLTNDESAIIYPVDGRTCSLRTYFDETYNDHYQWGRGHMLASSYRGCGNASNPAEINKQTFYSSNIAAQRAKSLINEDADCAFQILWGAAEKKIQDNYICADTLYVVSGAHFANEQTTAIDGNMYYLPTICKTCIVPTHFYKIVLRTKSGSTGKAIQECSADELKAVGFWFSNSDTDEQTGSTNPTLSRAHLRSVAEIEELTGNEFDFFPEVPDAVKQSYNPAEWGF